MDKKNSKSNNYVIREAENIIENYLRDRELSDIKRYYLLKQKYERLKILTIALFITMIIGTLINSIIK